MSPPPLGWLPPAGEPVRLETLLRAARETDPAAALSRGLRALLGCEGVTFHASGREALRIALAELARERGRQEVIVPAYTCFSVPAAAVAAGLRVRLVDVDADGRIDLAALDRLPLERAAALVVCNLFGIGEPLEPLAQRARAAGVAVVDDAAQSLGATGPEGHAVGGRGDLGILSFARGKPLSALGGGAIAWRKAPEGAGPTVVPGAGRAMALAKALVFDAALAAPVFHLLAAIPALEVGSTVYDVDFARGSAAGTTLVLAAAQLPTLAPAGAQREAIALALAERVRAETLFTPIVAPAGRAGVYPRLALRAPSAAARDRALARLGALGLGASGLYPSALGAIRGLVPDLSGSAETPGARDLAARILTLPTHGRLRGRLCDTAITELRAAAHGHAAGLR